MSSCVRHDWDDKDDHKDQLKSQSKKEETVTEASILDKVVNILNERCEYEDYEELNLDELIDLKDFYIDQICAAIRLIRDYQKSIK